MEVLVLFAVLIVAFPYVAAIVNWGRTADLRRRLADLEELSRRQEAAIAALTQRLREAKAAAAPPAAAEPRAAAPQALPPVPVVPKQTAPPAPPRVVEPAEPPPAVAQPSLVPPTAAKPAATPSVPPVTPAAAPPAAAARPPVAPPPPPLPPPPPRPPAREPFDWERVVGVKMFSAVAGVALVLAAVFFLRYSIDHGWLAPPVRVAIGVLVGIGLLIACELRAARKYPVTANALDAAAIAILFSTFFAAHALWQLIPATAAFGLLALVTGVAVLLSIRRDSVFIALLGLLGGFATPMLLSTGENRPVPLFAYLLLLNLGLAWVAARKRWRLLTILSIAFTTFYQWGWVITFLTASQLPLAMGVFLVFSLTGFASILFTAPAAPSTETPALARAGLAAAAMPLVFAAYLAAVPGYGAQPGLLFGFLLIVDAGLFAVTVWRRDPWAHALGAVAAGVVFATWLAVSYAHGAWTIAIGFASAFIVFFALAPRLAVRAGRPLEGLSARAIYAAPMLLFVFTAIARIEPAADAPARLFAPMLALLGVITWQAFARREFPLYYLAAFFAVVSEAAWSAAHLTSDHLRAAIAVYAAFGILYIGVPVAARRARVTMTPRWGGGVVLIASLLLLLYLAEGAHAAAALWGLAFLLAILNAGLFVESASGELPALSVVGGGVSWFVLAIWWGNAAAAVGLLPSLLFLVMLTLTMLVGYGWSHRQARSRSDFDPSRSGFRPGAYLGLIGYLFLFAIAIDPEWSVPPWPLFGALAVMTLALTTTSLAVDSSQLHGAGVAAAAIVVFACSVVAGAPWGPTLVAAAEVVAAYALAWVAVMRARGSWRFAAAGAIWTLFMASLTLGEASGASTSMPVAIVAIVAAANVALIFASAWSARWEWVAPSAVVAAWWVETAWHEQHIRTMDWSGSFALALVLYAVFVAYPVVLGHRARTSRDPYIAAIAGSALFFFTGRTALVQGGYGQFVGAVPVLEGAVSALLLRQLLRIEPSGSRDLGRLALVAGASLAFVTVAIPLQLHNQWITIGWALEGAALAWVYRRVPHRGLLYWSFALLAAVFARLALNPAVFVYEPRGLRVFNWYLYAYAVCAAAMFVAAWWLATTDDRILSLPRASRLLPAAAVILLFLLLNIEIADFYATGREIAFRFGVTLAQDLTYTIGWLAFGMLLLTGGIYLRNQPARVTAVALIAITAFKAFLYDTGSLGGLYRVGSLVGLAVSLSLVALALQKFVLHPSEGRA
ncbi:MAG TPA: DUF2339 domain-containing protein [Vicinamibacterales bacterium]|nr:DUF2339 domain-containing protein [Vicinamibacterales bacterium]